MGLLSRTPNGELEIEAMIAVIQAGLSETNGAGGGSGYGRGRRMRRRHSQTHQTDGLGESSRSRRLARDSPGPDSRRLMQQQCDRRDSQAGRGEVVVEVRLTDFGGCRLNALRRVGAGKPVLEERPSPKISSSARSVSDDKVLGTGG